MFEGFTDRARQVVVLAQEEAREHNHSYLGTEHILLGLLHVGDGLAARALAALDIDVDQVRNQVDQIIGTGVDVPHQQGPFTPRFTPGARKVFELSQREAKRLGQDSIDTEHLLLALIREKKGIAAQVLAHLGADRNSVGKQLRRLSAVT